MNQFLIGDILVRMDYNGMPVQSEGNLQLFQYDAPWFGDAATFRCEFEPLEPYMEDVVQRDNHVYGIYRHRSENFLIYHWGNLLHGFAVWPERFSASLNPSMIRQPPLREDWFFSVISFHRQLLNRNAFVLHSSYVDIGGCAVLFTGPSNMGKSTQADLWRKHAGARIINGDRTLLRTRNGVWNAFGYPCCGTSGICVNETLPIRAIVVLAQAKENRVEEISYGDKIRAIVSATECYPWDSQEIDMAFSVAEKLVSCVPVVKLNCRPDADAVEVLKKYLEESAYGNRV